MPELRGGGTLLDMTRSHAAHRSNLTLHTAAANKGAPVNRRALLEPSQVRFPDDPRGDASAAQVSDIVTR